MWHKPSSDLATVEIIGDFNGWKRPGRILFAERADGWRVTSLDLDAGEHTYAIVEDGVWLNDSNVPTTAFHDDREVTWLNVPSCERPALRVVSATGSPEGRVTIAAQLLASRAGEGLDPASVSAIDRDGRAFTATRRDLKTGQIELFAEGLLPGKYTITIRARDARGRDAEEAVATAWIEPRPTERSDLFVYQIVVDRYRGDKGPLVAPSMPSGRAGGTLNGVRAAIESGEIGALGVNALWLSPLYANPAGMFPGADGRPYSSYHGYWPSEPRSIEAALGTESDLDALVRAAHARGIRILFDVVPNHVHEKHPYVTAHPSWFRRASAACVCGSATCDWATHLEDCWFTSYLPDVDWRNGEAASAFTSDVRFWLDRFDGDGLRIDAVPMMPRAATRRIADSVRARYEHDGNRALLLGENFTGPGGYGQLRYALGPFGLDGEFHFPLMWALRTAVAGAVAPMSDIDTAIREGEEAWRGSGAVMATMIGNHDVTRFSSLSAGSADGDGWIAASQPADPHVYAKQRMALATVMTLPGIPVVYYGDEVALAGHSDPDSRRVLPAETALTEAQRTLRDSVRRMARLRACSEPLRRGTYRTLLAADEALVFAREVPGANGVIVTLMRTPSAEISAPLPGISAGDYIDVLTGEKASLRPELTNLGRAPFSVRILVPAGSACAP